MHPFWNNIALIYHKIYETYTFSNEFYANAVPSIVCAMKSCDVKQSH